MSRSTQRRRAGLRSVVAVLAGALVALALPVLAAPPALAGPCDPPNNAIVCENSKPGTQKDDWWIESPYGEIEGFATQTSVQPGEQLDFKIKTPSVNYTIDILRLGYYGGAGARLVAEVEPSVSLPTTQPFCAYESSTGLVDCGNWSVTASWTVPATVVPGFYVANFIREDQPGASQYPFVVRQDSSTSKIVIQTSDQTWQAYNKYGDRPGVNEFNLYEGGFAGSIDGRSYKVSYNRPYRNGGTASFLNAEYPLLRWIERNGYDVSYLSGVDVTRDPALLQNHDVYVSSGHDEYVNKRQRDGIEAARAAGVHMMFMSGNEFFWKTRFDASIDGTDTDYRTLVCFKETKTSPATKLDTSSDEWTGTWRDARLSPPYDAGRPENALTGTLFMVNGYRNDAIEVPAQYGRNRFWRDTSIATASTTTTLSLGTLGYEWNVDPDNGYRPAGAVPLSETTVTVDDGQLLLDDGWMYGGGPATHKMVLYRDQASRALVWGAGTVQWSWGLDATHLTPIGQTAPVDVRIQQATVNLLADMGAQPQTLMTGVVAATATADAQGPTVAVTSPADGATVSAGADVTITGTASDVATGDGAVGSVEVSVDDGVTWRRATGYDTWAYTWTPTTLGAASIKVRASDDSANLSAVTTRAVTVGTQQCPCTVFGTQTPGTVDGGEASAIEVGMKFRTTVNAAVTGVRFYKSAANTGTHTGSLWTAAGQRVATGTFTGETATGWQTLNFPAPVPISANTTYVVSYTAPNGHYSADSGYFASGGAGTAPVTAPAAAAVGGNGVFRYGSGFPDGSYNAANYWVDVVITTDGADNVAPTVLSTTPADGGSAVSTDAAVTATLSESVDPASVQLSVRAGASAPVLGVTSTQGPTVTFESNELYTANTTYTATLTASDGSGNPLAQPRVWTFTTGAEAAGCPCTLFRNATPATIDSGDGGDVEVGVKFRAAQNVSVTGVRFHKSAANTGTHTGTLWTAAGQVMATGTFTGESATGWQTLTFPNPVAIQANTTYVASYRAPNGHYSVDRGYFANPLTQGVLSAPAGSNGVFKYGGGFPNESFNSGNYWVDVVVATTGADNTPPTVTSTAPLADAAAVPTDADVSASFSEAVDPATVQFSLRAGVSTPVLGTTATTTTVAGVGAEATFSPNDLLAPNTTYTVTLTAKDTSGNALAAPRVWSFTTAASGSGCPCTLFRNATPPTADSGDGGNVELGVKFQSSTAANVTGVRFYKSAANTGTHTGTLWTATGQVMATGTFTGESATGWQTLTFPSPIQIQPNTTYVVSYHAPNGHYAIQYDAFAGAGAGTAPLTAPASGGAAGSNGVFSYGGGFPSGTWRDANYFVDVVLDTSGVDNNAPVVTTRTPATGATGVSTAADVVAVFDEPVTASSVQVTVTPSGGTPVIGSAVVAPDLRSVTFGPTADLAPSTTHTVSVRASDAAGNAMANPITWTFTTGTTGGCPCGVFRATDTPPNSAVDNPVTLGMRFQTASDGTVTAIRFHKPLGDPGTHAGALWSGNGGLLANGTFTGESASGWQTLVLSTPVTVTAGAQYVVSVHSSAGRYGHSAGVLPRTSGPVTGLGGAWSYVGPTAFPDGNGGATAYFVDVVFQP